MLLGAIILAGHGFSSMPWIVDVHSSIVSMRASSPTIFGFYRISIMGSGSLGFMMFCFVVMMHHSTNYQGYVEAVKADEP